MNYISKNNDLKVAIVGSGPAGFYAADHLFKKADRNIRIDMFDRLPTPYGLVRSGVAPDHQKIKSVTRVFDKIASNEKFRFFGYVDLGVDISLEELKKHYHQIVLATGAQTDRRLNIEGEDLQGSHPATEFVAWYNGHPDFKDIKFDLSAETAVIVGVGNVAIDVARILCLSEDELLKTDIADYALEALLKSNVKNIYLLGRRGPAQAAFTNPELKELGNLEIADVDVIEEEVELDPVSRQHLEETEDKSTTRKLELLNSFLIKNKVSKEKKIIFRFLASPVIINGNDSKVSSVQIVKNKLIMDKNKKIKPVPTDQYETINAGLIFRSIGYHGVPIPGVPFNKGWGVISNERGRITDEQTNQQINGLYTSGWIKRGPTGVIGTNKTDSSETVECMLEDIEKGLLLKPEHEDIKEILSQRKSKYFTYGDWNRINDFELSEGKLNGRPRVKIYEINKMLELVKN